MNKLAARKSNVLALRAPAMTFPEKHITNVLSGFEYDIAPLVPQLTQFLIYKMFLMAENKDPYTSLKGIELLAKTEWVGLFKERVEISVNTKTTEELQADLEALVIKIGYKTTIAPMISNSDEDETA